MKKPIKRDFNFDRRSRRFLNWKDEYEYKQAMIAYENRERKSGRHRTREIHPSWEPHLELFDSTNPQRSQGAFCRWANLNRGTFSAMQCKAIPLHITELVGAWNAQGKEVENG